LLEFWKTKGAKEESLAMMYLAFTGIAFKPARVVVVGTAEDDEFVQYLRRYWNKIVVAVNKTEGGRGQAEGYNYLRLGISNINFISAEHGDNIDALIDVLIDGLDFSKVIEAETDEIIRVTIVGKPNTGKSTLSNFLTKSSASIVSNIAGTTRDIVQGEFVYKGKKFVLQDTAGIRKKNKVSEDIEYYSVVRAIKSLDDADSMPDISRMGMNHPPGILKNGVLINYE